MGRTQQSSIKALLESIEQAKQKKEFNILKDLKTLRDGFGKIQKRDYLALIDKLMENAKVTAMFMANWCGIEED